MGLETKAGALRQLLCLKIITENVNQEVSTDIISNCPHSYRHMLTALSSPNSNPNF